MKNIILLLTIASIFNNVQADFLTDFLKGEDEKKEAGLSEFAKEIKELDKKIVEYKKELLEISKEMHKLRKDIIKKDPALKKLHNKIMALHRELAIKIDLNEGMKKLLKKGIKANNLIKEIVEEKRIKTKNNKESKGKKE